jgi:hypothetical protein
MTSIDTAPLEEMFPASTTRFEATGDALVPHMLASCRAA